MKIYTYLLKLLLEHNVNPEYAKYFISSILLLGILIISWIANFITKRVILVFVKHYVNRSKNKWDDFEIIN